MKDVDKDKSRLDVLLLKLSDLQNKTRGVLTLAERLSESITGDCPKEVVEGKEVTEPTNILSALEFFAETMNLTAMRTATVLDHVYGQVRSEVIKKIVNAEDGRR